MVAELQVNPANKVVDSHLLGVHHLYLLARLVVALQGETGRKEPMNDSAPDTNVQQRCQTQRMKVFNLELLTGYLACLPVNNHAETLAKDLLTCKSVSLP